MTVDPFGSGAQRGRSVRSLTGKVSLKCFVAVHRVAVKATFTEAAGGNAHLESAFNTIRSSGGRNFALWNTHRAGPCVLGVDTLTLW